MENKIRSDYWEGFDKALEIAFTILHYYHHDSILTNTERLIGQIVMQAIKFKEEKQNNNITINNGCKL